VENGFSQFVRVQRASFTHHKELVRAVYVSELHKSAGESALAGYISDKAPLFYRDPAKILKGLEEGYFLTPFKETLLRLPISESFRESHFGEITAAIFAQEVVGLRKIYSKLSLLTAENANAFKMDLILFDPNTDPITLIFGEVKSSSKSAADGLPAKHDGSCFASLFKSLNSYSPEDLEFDLTTAKDNIDALPEPERSKVKNALLPYAATPLKYAGFTVIDTATRDADEVAMLGTRKADKNWDVDVICVDEYLAVATKVYERLDAIRQACLQ
jgi:hypothetical protein